MRVLQIFPAIPCCMCACVRVWRNQSEARGIILPFAWSVIFIYRSINCHLSHSATLIFPPSTATPFIRVIFMKKDSNNKKKCFHQPIWKILSNVSKLQDRWDHVDLIKRRMVPQGRRFRQTNKTWRRWSKDSCIKQSTAERSPSLLLICRLLPHCYIKPPLRIMAQKPLSAHQNTNY